MRWTKKLTLESYLTDREDYLRAAKQDTQHLGDVARVCRGYVTVMRVAAAVAAVAVAEISEIAEVAEIAEAAAGAGAVGRGHPNDD